MSEIVCKPVEKQDEECEHCAKSDFVCSICYENAMVGEDGPNF